MILWDGEIILVFSLLSVQEITSCGTGSGIIRASRSPDSPSYHIGLFCCSMIVMWASSDVHENESIMLTSNSGSCAIHVDSKILISG